MNVLHRILSGQTKDEKHLIWAGIFILIWFGMDVIQFVAWLLEKTCK